MTVGIEVGLSVGMGTVVDVGLGDGTGVAVGLAAGVDVAIAVADAGGVDVGDTVLVAVGDAVRMTRSEQATPTSNSKDTSKTRGLITMPNQIYAEPRFLSVVYHSTFQMRIQPSRSSSVDGV